MATFVHFDISADDMNRAKQFYSKLFGWKFTDLSSAMNYSLIETTGLSGQKGLGGGLGKRGGSQGGIVNYIGVKSIDETIPMILSLGGKVIQGKQPVPGWGFLAVCQDTEHNTFGIFEESPK